MTFKLPMPKPDGGYDRRTVSGRTAEVLFPNFVRGDGPYARPTAAYDALPKSMAYGGRHARDQEEGGDDPIQKIKTFIMNCLSPEDAQRLMQMMQELSNGGEELDEESGEADGVKRWRDRVAAEDDPPSFRGMPRTGGKMASDSRGGGYLDAFPMNSLVDVNDYGSGGRR